MVRLVNITVPIERKKETMDKIQELSIAHIYQVNEFESKLQSHISFKSKEKHLQKVLKDLQGIGCGSVFGVIDVVLLVLSKPAFQISDMHGDSNKSKLTPKKRLYRISDRMTVDEIMLFIDDGNHLTFNYMGLITAASIISGAGLLQDSATTVIASMLVSPLMGPILSITFGLAIWDQGVIWRGVRNEAVGIILCFITGFVVGTAAAPFIKTDFYSQEIFSRGDADNLALGSIVAFGSGVAVVLAISMGGVNAIVGTAISASLLPPIVNCGLCLALAIQFHHRDDNTSQKGQEWARLGGISLSLFVMNLIIIIFVGLLCFRYVKNIYPQSVENLVKDKSKSVVAGKNFDGIHNHKSNGIKTPLHDNAPRESENNAISRMNTTTTDMGDYAEDYVYD